MSTLPQIIFFVFRATTGKNQFFKASKNWSHFADVEWKHRYKSLLQ